MKLFFLSTFILFSSLIFGADFFLKEKNKTPDHQVFATELVLENHQIEIEKKNVKISETKEGCFLELKNTSYPDKIFSITNELHDLLFFNLGTLKQNDKITFDFKNLINHSRALMRGKKPKTNNIFFYLIEVNP